MITILIITASIISLIIGFFVGYDVTNCIAQQRWYKYYSDLLEKSEKERTELKMSLNLLVEAAKKLSQISVA